MLFSEPKIPQFDSLRYIPSVDRRFSALQRAENSSIVGSARAYGTSNEFQCSSASRKFLNSARTAVGQLRRPFQCSSASRKFLNPVGKALHIKRWLLFQCSSASRKFLNCRDGTRGGGYGEFQCSSASRKFLNAAPDAGRSASTESFSALQRAENSSIVLILLSSTGTGTFQCSSASRKFLNSIPNFQGKQKAPFQCSSASRKFLNDQRAVAEQTRNAVSVLFSEPKIPQLRLDIGQHRRRSGFSALQRAENSSIRRSTAMPASSPSFSALQRAENSSMQTVRPPDT